jgi:hypothetical protein
MPKGRYLVSVNGFRCNRQSWDDALNWDGKADEVYIAIGRKMVNKTGTILDSQDPVPTPVMGDTWNHPNRIQAGKASDRGGIITEGLGGRSYARGRCDIHHSYNLGMGCRY